MAGYIKNTYVVSLYGGYGGIIKARTLKFAEKRALKEHGTRNLKSVKPATQADIISFVAMGGYYNEEEKI